MISANNVSLEGVDYATAVQVLRDSGQTVDLVVKRRVVLPPTLPAPNLIDQPKYLNVSLSRLKKKEDFGVVLGCKIYVKEIINRSIADRDSTLKEGDEIVHINGTALENLSLKEAKKVVENAKDKMDLQIKRHLPRGIGSGLGQQKENNLNKVEATQPVNMPPRPPLPMGKFCLYVKRVLCPCACPPILL